MRKARNTVNGIGRIFPKKAFIVVQFKDGKLWPASNPAIHWEYLTAHYEAERLAKVSPGDSFVVMETRAQAYAPPQPLPTVTTL
jgi:hypothetical protein